MMEGHRCPDIRKDLHAFLDHELDAGANQEVLRHLSDCPACAATLEGEKGFDAFLRERIRPVPAPEGLWDRISTALDEAPPPAVQKPPALRLAPPRPRLIPFSVAAAFLGFVVWANLDPICGIFLECSVIKDSVRGRLAAMEASEETLTFPDIQACSEMEKRRQVTTRFGNPFPYLTAPDMSEFGFLLKQAGPVHLPRAERESLALTYVEMGHSLVVLVFPGQDLHLLTKNRREIDSLEFYEAFWEGNRVVCWRGEHDGIICALVSDISSRRLESMALALRTRD